MDWREIFKKYIEMVGLAEGVYFIDESQFTPEENAEINKVIDENHSERARENTGRA